MASNLSPGFWGIKIGKCHIMHLVCVCFGGFGDRGWQTDKPGSGANIWLDGHNFDNSVEGHCMMLYIKYQTLSFVVSEKKIS